MNVQQDIDLYTSNLEHIKDELYLMDYIIRCHINMVRDSSIIDDEFMGLYISEKDVTKYLNKDPFHFEKPSDQKIEKQIQLITEIREAIDRKVAASKENGLEFRLERLGDTYKLGDLEKNTLVLCLTQEIDLKYGKLFAYLHNDITRKRLSVDLVLNLFSNSFEEKQRSIKLLAPGSSLVKHHLVKLTDELEGIHLPILERIVEIDGQIMDFLIGEYQINEKIAPFARLYDGPYAIDDLVLSDGLKYNINAAIHLFDGEVPSVVFLQGPHGSGKKASASVISSHAGKDMLVVDIGRMIGPVFAMHSELVCREALLRNASLYFDNFDQLFAEDVAWQFDVLLTMLEDFPGTVFLGSETYWEPAGSFQEKKFIHLDVPLPAFSERKKLFEKYLSRICEGSSKLEDDDIDELSTKFKFGASRIIAAIHSAKNIAALETAINKHMLVTEEHLRRGCKAQSNKKLLQYASNFKSNYDWDDLVLPSDTIEQLKEIPNYIKNYHVVYSEWGFGKKSSIGKGLTILFAGPSGTGKTMSAGIIAKDLKLDLYKIDLSGVVSKYIGETEKNLDRIFDEAQTSNSIIFFDEADAIFGKRTAVKDAHDRYANIETSYLLQKMEEYEGIVILASNMKSNIDDAFLRRMRFSINFPAPDETCREMIWRKMFPEKESDYVDKDIDYKFLARRFKLSGGNISNIHIAAAFLASGERETIGMKHIIRATRRELQKLGWSITAADFGDYYEYIKGD